MRSPFPTALALLSLAALSGADEHGPGLQIVELPGGPTYVTTALPNGEFVGIGNLTIAHFEEDGTLIQTLHTFPDWVGGEGITVDPTGTFVVASRSDGSSSGTYRVDLAGGPATFLSFLSSSTLLFEGPDSILVNVTDGFFGWWVYRMDVNTGAITPKSQTFTAVIAAIALDAAGNLYIAHEPSMAGNTGIERFDASQVAGPGLLASGGGTVVHENLDNVFALQVAPDGSTFYASESPTFLDGRISELRPGSRRELARVSKQVTVYHLQLLGSKQPGQYLSTQPALAGDLIYQTYASEWKRKAVLPARRGQPVR